MGLIKGLRDKLDVATIMKMNAADGSRFEGEEYAFSECVTCVETFRDEVKQMWFKASIMSDPDNWKKAATLEEVLKLIDGTDWRRGIGLL